MGMKDSAKSLGAKLKLDSHHAIERFGVLFGAIAISFVTIFAGTGISAYANNQTALSSTALYTPTFLTSKTQLSGNVPGVFVSEDRTRAMVLMQFNDTASVSANAEDYRGFLTGSTKNLTSQDLKTDVTGSVVVFGSTGYMGVLLDSDEPFAPQIMDLTMRSDTELTYNEENSATDKNLPADSSFQKHDQWRVFFNPGGSEAVVSSALGTDKVDVGAIFNEIVIAPKEKDIRSRMDSQLAIMKTDLNRIHDATAELERTTADGGTLRLMPPAEPAQIAGDEITGQSKVENTASTLDLNTEYVIPLGYDFDWRGGSVKDGYLKDLIPEGSNYVTYLAQRAQETPDRFTVNDMKWLLNDGSDLKRDHSSASTTVKPLLDIMNKLSGAYQDYYKNKSTYQVELHDELLDLEVELRNVESNFTKHSGEDVLLTY
ncbi:hypothetical protein [Arthrobacter koreensis]|uniref:hypothetical protein n=1 Tax=Arthrobacter koreensis TaxID=199136 RepID=UPI0037F3DA7F